MYILIFYDMILPFAFLILMYSIPVQVRALSEGLKCPIVVFSAEGAPLTMGAEHAVANGVEQDAGDKGWDKKKALLLSFHRHYYALGEHYNSVRPK